MYLGRCYDGTCVLWSTLSDFERDVNGFVTAFVTFPELLLIKRLLGLPKVVN